ncbi:hypothetical protein DFH27DRAFT_639404 [Peziza echinospora]|nr:hypothetical protein DFH27DRAFT_639404 [Peziza echinospora]
MPINSWRRGAAAVYLGTPAAPSAATRPSPPATANTTPQQTRLPGSSAAARQRISAPLHLPSFRSLTRTHLLQLACSHGAAHDGEAWLTIEGVSCADVGVCRWLGVLAADEPEDGANDGTNDAANDDASHGWGDERISDLQSTLCAELLEITSRKKATITNNVCSRTQQSSYLATIVLSLVHIDLLPLAIVLPLLHCSWVLDLLSGFYYVVSNTALLATASRLGSMPIGAWGLAVFRRTSPLVIPLLAPQVL